MFSLPLLVVPGCSNCVRWPQVDQDYVSVVPGVPGLLSGCSRGTWITTVAPGVPPDQDCVPGCPRVQPSHWGPGSCINHGPMRSQVASGWWTCLASRQKSSTGYWTVVLECAEPGFSGEWLLVSLLACPVWQSFEIKTKQECFVALCRALLHNPQLIEETFWVKTILGENKSVFFSELPRNHISRGARGSCHWRITQSDK